MAPQRRSDYRLINEFELPLYYIGVGEKIEHLQSFNSELFAEALFS